jgi:hypothetical protein
MLVQILHIDRLLNYVVINFMCKAACVNGKNVKEKHHKYCVISLRNSCG